jgi:RNA polymerase sigma factor (sigma-70 family)
MTDPNAPILADANAPLPTTRAFDPDRIVSEAFEAHHRHLYSFLLRTGGDDAAAQDLVQDAFVKLTREVRAGRLPGNIGGWLFTVASNLAVSRGRRLSVARGWFQREAARASHPRHNDSPERALLARDRMRELEHALAGLSPDARAALLLSGQGLKGTEISAAIGRSHGATRTLMCRARVQLRRALDTGELGA